MYSDQMEVEYTSSETDEDDNNLGGGGGMEADNMDYDPEPPRLNMKHGFIHHIRQNQIDRDNYDKQVRQKQPLKQQKSRISRLLNQPERRKHPETQLYTPPKNSSGEGMLYTPPARRESLEKKLYSPPPASAKAVTNRTPSAVESRLYTPPSKRTTPMRTTTPKTKRTTPKSKRTTPVALKASEVARREAASAVKSPDKRITIRETSSKYEDEDDDDDDILYELQYTDRTGQVHRLKVRDSDNPRELAESLREMADVPEKLVDALEWKIEQEQMKKAEETS